MNFWQSLKKTVTPTIKKIGEWFTKREEIPSLEEKIKPIEMMPRVSTVGEIKLPSLGGLFRPTKEVAIAEPKVGLEDIFRKVREEAVKEPEVRLPSLIKEEPRPLVEPEEPTVERKPLLGPISVLAEERKDVKTFLGLDIERIKGVWDFIKRVGKTPIEIGRPIEETPEIKFGLDIERIKDTGTGVKVFGEGLKYLPQQVRSKITTAIQGYKGASIADRDKGDIQAQQAQTDIEKFIQETGEKYEGKTLFGIPMKEVAALPQNLSYSVVSMGAGLGVGVPVGIVPLPGFRIAGWVIGTAASGKVAFNMTSYEIMQEYLEIKNEEMVAKEGREITLEEENQLKKDFESTAKKYGLWEAVPEAISNLAFVGILTAPLTKMFGKSIAGRITGKLSAIYGEEFLTETITEMGQTEVRGNVGLPGGKKVDWTDPEDWMIALKNVAPQTFLLTTVMAGTGSVMVTSKDAVKKLDVELGKKHPLYNQFKEKITEMAKGERGAIGIAPEEEPAIPKELESLAEEARKYKSAEEFIESVRLPAGIKNDTVKLAELDKMGREEKIRLYDSIEEFNESRAIVKRNLESGKKALERLKLETNKLAEQTIDLLRKANIEGRGWFDQARNFYTQATKEVKPIEARPIRTAVYPPNVYANQTDKWSAQIREGGFALEERFFDTEKEAKEWVKNYIKEIKPVEIKEAPKEPISKFLPKELVKKPAPFVKKRATTLLKARIRTIARGVRMGRITTKAQIKEAQTELLNLLDKTRLTLKDKAKFRRTIKNIQTKEQLAKRLPEIEKRIGKLEEAETRRSLRNKIWKELKKIRVRKVAGKPVGRFTPEIQRVLTIIRNAAKLNAEGIQNQITANLEKYQDQIPTDEIALENYILSNWITGLDTMNNAELTKLLNKITELKETGRMASELQKFNRQADISRWRDDAMFVVTGGKGLPPGISTVGVRPENLKTIKEKAQGFISGLGKEIVGWKDILDMLSVKDKTSKPGESRLNKFGDVLDEKNAEKKGNRITIQKIKNFTKRTLELKTDREMIKRFRQDSKEESLGFYKTAEGVNKELFFTKAEARKRWMELQDPKLDETFRKGMFYTDEIIEAINNFLTPQDKAFAKAQLEFYQEYYDSINKVYRDIYGVDLPKSPNYSPLSREGVDRNISEGFGEFMQEIFIRRQVTSKSLKTRVANIRPLKAQNDIGALEQHIVEMEHFKTWAHKMRDLNSVFGNSTFRTAVKINHSRGVLSVLDGFMNDFTRGGTERAGRLKMWDKIRGNFSRAVLAVKLSIGVKQLTSFIAFADAIPTKDFVIGTADWAKNPIKKTKILLGSELMRERGKGLERDIKTAMKTDKWANFRKRPNFLNSLMLNIQVGDKGAIVMGGWSIYRYHIKKGLTHDQAIKKFESITESTQQSADLSELSKWQRGGTFAKLFTMFRSAPNQYVRKEIGAIRNFIVGRQGIVKTAKTLLIFHFLLPMFFQWVSDAFEWDPKEQKRAAIFGPLNGLFILGDMIEGVVRTALGIKVYPSEIPIYGIANDLMKAMRELTADDIDTEDVMDSIRAILGFTGSVTGIPLKSPFDISTGVKDIFTGLYEQGFFKVLGWSPFVAEKKKEKKEKKEDKFEYLFKPEPSKKEKTMEDIFKLESEKDKLDYLFK